MTQTLNSSGYLCGLLQRSHSAVQGAIGVLGIKPAAVINGIKYYEDQDLERVSAHLRRGGSTKPKRRAKR